MRRTMASSLGKMPTTSVRRLISPLRRSIDTRELLDNEGIDDTLRRSFLVYLVSASRPIHEILTARRRDMTADFERGFEGMTEEPVTLEQLNAARETFITQVVGTMPDAHRKFLISFVRGNPNWASIGLPKQPVSPP